MKKILESFTDHNVEHKVMSDSIKIGHALRNSKIKPEKGPLLLGAMVALSRQIHSYPIC